MHSNPTLDFCHKGSIFHIYHTSGYVKQLQFAKVLAFTYANGGQHIKDVAVCSILGN